MQVCENQGDHLVYHYPEAIRPVVIPKYKEYSVPQVKMVLNEIEQGISKRVSIIEWENL